MKTTENNLVVKIKVIGLLLFIAATSLFTYAQVPRTDDEIDALLDELFFSEDQLLDDILASLNRNEFIYTSVTFNSNTYFSGRDSGIDQYNFYPQISYYHPSGFSLSLSGLYYEKFDPNWDFTSASLGYSHTLDKKERFYISTGYTHYFYSDGSNLFTESIDLGFGLQNKHKTFGTSLSATYLFGNDDAFQLISSTYGRISLYKEKTFSIKFNPRLNFLIASQTIALEELNSQTDEYEFINYDVFNLLNTQLRFPISLTTKSWNFDVGYVINLPNPVAAETDLKSTGFFTVSLGYLINLNKK